MPAFVFVMFIKAVIAGARAFRSKVRQVKPDSLCAGCFHAHVQYGANGRRAASCTYGGAVRLVKLDVLYCTDFQERNQPARQAMGFVREIADTE